MSVSTVGEARKINVLVVGESPRLFSSSSAVRKDLDANANFAESHREVSALLSHTKHRRHRTQPIHAEKAIIK